MLDVKNVWLLQYSSPVIGRIELYADLSLVRLRFAKLRLPVPRVRHRCSAFCSSDMGIVLIALLRAVSRYIPSGAWQLFKCDLRCLLLLASVSHLLHLLRSRLSGCALSFSRAICLLVSSLTPDSYYVGSASAFAFICSDVSSRACCRLRELVVHRLDNTTLLVGACLHGLGLDIKSRQVCR